jgi:hypothetical protein
MCIGIISIFLLASVTAFSVAGINTQILEDNKQVPMDEEKTLSDYEFKYLNLSYAFINGYFCYNDDGEDDDYGYFYYSRPGFSYRDMEIKGKQKGKYVTNNFFIYQLPFTPLWTMHWIKHDSSFEMKIGSFRPVTEFLWFLLPSNKGCQEVDCDNFDHMYYLAGWAFNLEFQGYLWSYGNP